MKISLYTLTSALHDPAKIESSSQCFLEEIATAAHVDFDVKGEDFDDYSAAEMPVIFIRTGGTEAKFKEILPHVRGYVRLLTSGKSNSLAASMEILSFLRQQGRPGEIWHGSVAVIAQHIETDYRVEQARLRLNGARLGVVGAPSDWLIASEACRDSVLEKLGVTLVDIPMEELLDCYRDIDTQSEEWQVLMQGEEARRLNDNAPQTLRLYFEGAFKIYLALERLIKKYALYGFTLRCFDLLTQVHNTGCLALSMFNDKGIPAACEGDVPALLTMVIGRALTGFTGFQANPSRLDVESNEIVFAHCTVPMNMVKNCSYDTHFESGIGIGLKGEFVPGPVTIAKVSGDLSRYWFCPAELVDNLSEKELCRTQIVVRGRNFSDYFLKSPIGNHHVIFPGSLFSLFSTFMNRVNGE